MTTHICIHISIYIYMHTYKYSLSTYMYEYMNIISTTHIVDGSGERGDDPPKFHGFFSRSCGVAGTRRVRGELTKDKRCFVLV